MLDTGIRKRIEDARAIIFDVDGTLAETEETHRHAFNDTFAHFKLPWKWDAVLYGELLKVTGGKERMRHFSEVYLNAGGAVTKDVIAAMHVFKTQRYKKLIDASECKLRPGVRGVIEAALSRGQRLAVATTTSRGNVEALLVSTLGPGAMKMFSAVVAGDEVARKKPAPDVYLRVLEELALTGAECLAIEDSRNGLVAAIDADIPVIVTPSYYSRNDDFSGAIAVLRDIEDY